MAETIRLDLFLWFARFAKTRGLAQRIAAEGHVRIDGRPVDKPSACVRVGQVIGLAVGGRVRVVRVEALPARRGPAPEARACYSEIEAPG